MGAVEVRVRVRVRVRVSSRPHIMGAVEICATLGFGGNVRRLTLGFGLG